MSLVNYDLNMIAHYSRGIIGMDEVGRGCLAGPVVVCAVFLDEELIEKNRALLDTVNDSKKLTAKKRAHINLLASSSDIPYCIVEGGVKSIDTNNILGATLKSMNLACYELIQQEELTPGIVLIDGDTDSNSPFLKERGIKTKTVIKGDSTSSAIALASNLAKVYRDCKMVRLGEEFPGYGWEDNAGYGVPKHMQAIRDLGVTPQHRMSFSLDGKKLSLWRKS